jgi:hypothetical protein
VEVVEPAAPGFKSMQKKEDGLPADSLWKANKPTIGDAILDRTIHNAYRLCLPGDSQRKLRANQSMPHT